ncbi:MFS transporter [Advenella sp. RU8]|uniref:MFS transporter n=1 Tax=Advenella sp. RU8 TaxID=3399575 RepID=UPI003AB042C1
MQTIQEENQEQHWKRNLYVCVFGSFTTLMAMTLVLPFLPIYIEELGETDPASIIRWSGYAFSATFLSAGLMAPVWGKFADHFGRKPILIRASLGMAFCIALMGMVSNVQELVGLRLLIGILGGYASGATILVATQTPKAHTGWAVGTHAAGMLAGNLLGPLVGGFLPGYMGIRNTFFLAAGVIFIAFLATTLLIKETSFKRKPAASQTAHPSHGFWHNAPSRNLVLLMLACASLLMFANYSVEPIITIYMASLHTITANIPLLAGIAISVTAFGSLLGSARIGRLGDRKGHLPVLIGCFLFTALTLLLQAFATADWQFIALRFLMGVGLSGLMPAITALIRHNVAGNIAGTVLGYSTSAQYLGMVLGPLAGGMVGNLYGIDTVFYMTAGIMASAAILTAITRKRQDKLKINGTLH